MGDSGVFRATSSPGLFFRSFSHFSFCNVGRRLLTQAISQLKFHENWATKLGIKKKDKGKYGEETCARNKAMMDSNV